MVEISREAPVLSFAIDHDSRKAASLALYRRLARLQVAIVSFLVLSKATTRPAVYQKRS